LARLTVFLALAGLALLAAGPAPGRAAEADGSIRVVSWASPVGAQALSYDSLPGLQALLSFLNANRALGGREAKLFSLESDDSLPDFAGKLEALMDSTRPQVAVGGAAHASPRATADFFRRRGLLWYGPWSNSQELKTADGNPVLTLPTDDLEIEALMGYAGRLGLSEVAFVHSRGGQAAGLAALAQASAKANGLGLKPLGLPLDFRNWQSLITELQGAQAVFLWVPPGQAAAIVRSLKPLLGPQALWATNSLNATGHELAAMTAGQWENVVFPAVLIPKKDIPRGYDFVIHKYGLPGLTLDYQAYLGFAQGQLLARALAESDGDPARLRQAFANLRADGTILAPPPAAGGKSFYLAASDARGDWRALE
jgi:ABC-type branched-subunit amino acid transport system substrate-binding protein